jgi:hypothetical protein
MLQRSMPIVLKYARAFLLIAIAGLMSASGLRAQYRWYVTQYGWNGNYSYSFRAIDCSGQVCIAAAIRTNTSIRTTDRNVALFFRSTDAGLTWTQQDPGLPHEQTDNNIAYMLHGVQQIDSLNAVGIGDSGTIVRTTDGGMTWNRQNLNTPDYVSAVHFSDPMTGIVTTDRPDSGLSSACNIYTTHDGGSTWTLAPFSPWLLAVTCHSDGGNNFRVISDDIGPVYITSNDWETVDSTPLIIPLSDSVHNLYGFRFEGMDTIVACGSQNENASNFLFEPSYIVASVDGGYNWMPFNMPDTIITHTNVMSPLDRNVVFMAGTSDRKIAVSHDHGMTWEIDTLLQDTAYPPQFALNITTTSDGHGIGIFSPGIILVPSYLARIDPASPSRVESHSYAGINYGSFLYPNPTTGIVNIDSAEAMRPVQILNILGIAVMSGVTSAQGQLTLDLSALPSGVYFVQLNYEGDWLKVGWLALLSK